MHFRQTIRAELKARAASLPGMTSSVVDSLAQAIEQRSLPTAAVTLTGEDADPPVSLAAGESTRRVLTASIVIVAYRPDDLEKMAEALEVRMADPLAAGVLHRMTGTRFQDPVRGEFDFFSLAIDYEIRFSLLSSDPSRVAP